MDVNWLATHFPELSNLVAASPSGQKEVFYAEHKSEGPVVLKIFKPGANVERIEREMEAPLKVKSARVPPVLEFGKKNAPTGEVIWLRERRMTGESLQELLRARGTLDVGATIRIALHVTEVLSEAEAAGVVHRDIKPGNIIIAPDGSAWVIDFGLARHLDLESVTQTADVFAPCTPGFAPVEQFTNQKQSVDSRADLFALGVTLHMCLTGTNPFTHGTIDRNERFKRVATQTLPRITLKDVPSEFADFVEALTRTKAEHRPSSAAEAFQWIADIAKARGIA